MVRLLLLVLLTISSCNTNKESLASDSHSKEEPPKAEISVNIVNEAQLSEELLQQITKKILYWTPKVYAYNYADPGPVTCILTNNRGVGTYYRRTIHLPAFFRPQSIVETYIHELGHHATGTRSRMFFKEGIATATLEVVLEEENQIPDTWPQYGQTNDNWARLLLKKKAMVPLEELINWAGFQGGSDAGDFGSWQVYTIGGSFIKWYISKYGYKMFRASFRNRKFHKSHRELEKEWKNFLGDVSKIDFYPGDYFPRLSRYDYFIDRLQ
ncbi:hypothetical protein [Candidatus Uabimicrobium sp. HlEnr_7]|uniref:hypothetical protein n=1 Tax=Candidatus Uabimicrobium helgolandensis TaxID=3095367 RepID=UPI0035590808